MIYPSLPIDQLNTWAQWNGVSFHGVEVRSSIVIDGIDKGGGLVASQNHEPSTVLLKIPRDLVLNKLTIQDAARVDKHLRELLEAIGTEFAQSPRLSIMIFLLLQATHLSSNLSDKSVGVTMPLTDYVKFLPKKYLLPTFYNAQEQELLSGTSLEAALQQKSKRLEQEFSHLRSATSHIEWCQDFWWKEDSEPLELSDWILVDAMYRSRALELPRGMNASMVPVLDMANHGSNNQHNARFEVDEGGNVQLIVRDDLSVKQGDEITIMYGFGGACEMIFSYGFLDRDARSARELFLDLKIPNDDPLKRIKIEFAREAPGVRLYTNRHGQIEWESSFVWWACVNEEDGLDFQVLRRVDGSTELKATWKGAELVADGLKELLMQDPLRDVFRLRATVLVQSRVEMQGMELSLSQDDFDAAHGQWDDSPNVETISRLRDLEMELLASCYQTLEAEKIRLSASDSVRTYLTHQDPDRSDGMMEEDFS